MNILHISDIHFRLQYEPFVTGYKGMISKMDNPLIHLKTALDHAKSMANIDLLLISGDLTEDGTPEDYAHLKKWIEAEMPKVPIVITLGNHDIKTNFRLGWLNESEGNEDYYNVVTEFEDFYLISFDSAVYEANDGDMLESQFKWLEEQLNTFQDKEIYLMTHHHLFENQCSTPALPQSNQLIDLISQYSVTCLLNGHTHHTFTGDINGIQYYTVGGMSFVGEDEGDGLVRFDQRFSYNLYKVVEGKIIHQTTENFVLGKTIDKVDMKKKML